MFLERWLKPGPAKRAGRRLYAAAVEAARAPTLYAVMGAPDTPDGRFELYTLHVLLLAERLRAQGAAGRAVAQALFDDYVSGLDNGLRELAVGDLSVARTMRRLGEAYYGRAKAIDAAFEALPERAPLEALLLRTVFSSAEGADPAPLATYLLAAREGLDAAPPATLLKGEAPWPAAS